MSDDEAYATRLIRRLDGAARRNQLIANKDLTALEKLNKVITTSIKGLKGDEAVMAVLREVYSILEENAEESQSTIVELKEARDLIQMSCKLLEDAGFDFANIGTAFGAEDVWLGNHLPTIKLALNIFNLIPRDNDISLFEQALDSLDKERFEDIAHAVKRSGQKRNETHTD